MDLRSVSLSGHQVPSFLYGTAWKEERTAHLVRLALDAGFLGIDTANQRKHYHEAGVGETLKAAFAAGLDRDSLFLQTKFTYRRGQDHRLPYDPQAPFATQVAQSFESSLAHLGTDRLDSYVLHGPYGGYGIAKADREVWRAMEELHGAGKTRLLGVSNVSLEQLEQLWDFAAVKPSFVQNRCYASDGWDSAVRGFCTAHGVRYQGFSLLTANRGVLRAPAVQSVVERTGCTPAQVVFRFALEVGMVPLTGTSDPVHMRQDLAVYDALALSDEERAAIESAGC